MGLAWLFLSFNGRIGREVWWLVVAFRLCLDRALYPLVGDEEASNYLTVALALAALQIAPTVKRLHDVGRSGWWFFPYVVLPGVLYYVAVSTGNNIVFVLASFAGLILAMWVIFELGFVKGSARDNRYGHDPLR